GSTRTAVEATYRTFAASLRSKRRRRSGTTHSYDRTTATVENSPAVATNGKQAEDASHRPI
ncbi:hypothetical protein M514_08676, partial [Trichuris suis]